MLGASPVIGEGILALTLASGQQPLLTGDWQRVIRKKKKQKKKKKRKEGKEKKKFKKNSKKVLKN